MAPESAYQRSHIILKVTAISIGLYGALYLYYGILIALKCDGFVKSQTAPSPLTGEGRGEGE